MEVYLILIAALAFILTFIDVSFGMGFSVMAPTLIILDFPTKEVIPAVLVCSVIFGIVGGLFHQKHKNVNFGRKTKSLKITTFVSIIGILGVFAGAKLAIDLPEDITKYYIAGLMMVLGLILIFKHKKEKLVNSRSRHSSMSGCPVGKFFFLSQYTGYKKSNYSWNKELLQQYCYLF